jgi:hypothetical protein
MLDPKEEKRFEELRGMCRELKVPAPPEIMIGLKVHDKNGVLTFDDVQRGHSWTRNFWNFIFGVASTSRGIADATFVAGKMSGKTTAAAIRSDAASTSFVAGQLNTGPGFNNVAATANSGIVVGTGDTAFSTADYILATLIAHGNAATQLSYNPMSGGSLPSYTGGSKTWKGTLTRLFNNNSGGSITVKEVGLIFAGGVCWTASEYYLFERSVLAPTVAVANGAQLTVTYEISMDFSAID